MKGTFIQDNEGVLIEVTDIKQALQDAKMYNYWHEKAYLNRNEPDFIYYKDAHAYWKDILFKLEKLSLKFKHNKPKQITNTQKT